MHTNYIMRPVFNRPEMLQLSIESEIEARTFFSEVNFNLKTVFIIEYGFLPEVIDIIEKYPYDCEYVYRKQRYGLSKNILEGLKYCFAKTDDFVIYIEDDVLIHKTYFQYIKCVLDMLIKKWSVLSSYTFEDLDEINAIRLDRHYAALAPVINKYFFEKYIEPCACDLFYTRPVDYVLSLNDMYKPYQKDRKYRYKDAMHHQQAGLINRLCDVARIEEDISVIMPFVNRSRHIGFFGYNRPGGSLKGLTFEERLKELRLVIQSKEAMYKTSKAKQYNDYRVFSNLLDSWDGTLYWSNKNYIS